jgi:4-alpha-glucanotransferase
MMQAQDILGLGSEARMNLPARAGGNWEWRMESGGLTAALAGRLRAVTEETGRLG